MSLNHRFQKSSDETPAEGVYCDVYGTLVNSSFEANRPLVEYLNALHESGVKVTIFSSDHFGMRRKTQNIGLHVELAGIVRNKANFADMLLETLIDDDPPAYIRAQKHWNPKSEEFRAYMKEEMAKLTRKPAAPPPPAP